MSRVVVAPGQAIGSAWGNQVMDQGCIVFASAAQRSTDWPAPPNGAESWLADSNTPWIFRGGSWHPYPLGYLASAVGPASQTDVSAITTVASVSVPVITGRRYRIHGGGIGTQITAAGPIVYLQLADGDGVASRITQANGLAVGSALAGYGTVLYAPAASKTATIALQALASTGALRFTANQANISVDDIGG